MSEIRFINEFEPDRTFTYDERIALLRKRKVAQTEEKAKAGGADEDDEEPMFEYVTIYALDARGERKEVPHFLDYGLFVGQDGEASVEVELSPDWRFGLSRYAPDGVLEEACSGSFSEKERGDGLDKFNFRVTSSARRAGEDFRVDERVRTGRFTAREVGLSYEVTLTGADYFKAGTEFRDARLLDADEHIEYD